MTSSSKEGNVLVFVKSGTTVSVFLNPPHAGHVWTNPWRVEANQKPKHTMGRSGRSGARRGSVAMLGGVGNDFVWSIWPGTIFPDMPCMTRVYRDN